MIRSQEHLPSPTAVAKRSLPFTPRKQDAKINELPPNRESPVATTGTGRLGSTRRKYRGSLGPVRALVADEDGRGERGAEEEEEGGRGGERYVGPGSLALEKRRRGGVEADGRKRAWARAPRRTGFFRFPPRVFLSPSLASRGCVFLGRGRNYKIQYGGWGENWRGFGRPPVLVAVAAPPPPSLSRAAIANAPSPGLPCPEPLEF